MRKWLVFLSTLAACLLVPIAALAAGDLVVVADTRRITSFALRYFADLYNTNIVLFAVWAVVLTALYGSFLGVFMDFIMKRTGIDLKSRKIVEH